MIWLGKKNIYRSAIIIGLFILAGFLYAPVVKAVTLIPPSLEIGLKPGTEYKTVVKLYNETADPIVLYTETRSFTAKGETGQPDFDFESEPIDLSAWVEIEPGPITIEPGKRYEVPVTITPPVNADPGGHYATIFFSSAPPEEGQLRISSKVGTLILARVDGEILEMAAISEFSTLDSQKVFNRLPVEFYARINNTGNVHLKPSGQVTISGWFVGDDNTIEFNPGQGATLPKTTRKYDLTWDKGTIVEKPGNFWSDFWQEYGNERNNFALGKYKAVLNLTAGTTGTATITDNNAEITYWIIPWHILLVWLIVAVLGILVLLWLIKKYNSWIVQKSQANKK